MTVLLRKTVDDAFKSQPNKLPAKIAGNLHGTEIPRHLSLASCFLLHVFDYRIPKFGALHFRRAGWRTGLERDQTPFK
jgi:hypothetical protein